MRNTTPKINRIVGAAMSFHMRVNTILPIWTLHPPKNPKQQTFCPSGWKIGSRVVSGAPHRGKGKKTGKSSGSAAKANVAEEEVEEEEIEDEALLSDKKKRKRKPQAKMKGKAQPAGSAANEADADVDDDGFAYSAVSFPYDTISSNKEWCLKGAKGVQEEVEDGTSMTWILDAPRLCRHAYLLMRLGRSVELLPDSSIFNFANGQKALAREKCRIWFSYEPPLFTDFSIIDEGKVPFLMSLPQMKNLGVSLDLRGTPERILFHTGLLTGQGVPLHRNRAGHHSCGAGDSTASYREEVSPICWAESFKASLQRSRGTKRPWFPTLARELGLRRHLMQP